MNRRIGAHTPFGIGVVTALLVCVASAWADKARGRDDRPKPVPKADGQAQAARGGKSRREVGPPPPPQPATPPRRTSRIAFSVPVGNVAVVAQEAPPPAPRSAPGVGGATARASRRSTQYSEAENRGIPANAYDGSAANSFSIAASVPQPPADERSDRGDGRRARATNAFSVAEAAPVLMQPAAASSAPARRIVASARPASRAPACPGGDRALITRDRGTSGVRPGCPIVCPPPCPAPCPANGSAGNDFGSPIWFSTSYATLPGFNGGFSYALNTPGWTNAYSYALNTPGWTNAFSYALQTPGWDRAFRFGDPIGGTAGFDTRPLAAAPREAEWTRVVGETGWRWVEVGAVESPTVSESPDADAPAGALIFGGGPAAASPCEIERERTRAAVERRTRLNAVYDPAPDLAAALDLTARGDYPSAVRAVRRASAQNPDALAGDGTALDLVLVNDPGLARRLRSTLGVYRDPPRGALSDADARFMVGALSAVLNDRATAIAATRESLAFESGRSSTRSLLESLLDAQRLAGEATP